MFLIRARKRLEACQFVLRLHWEHTCDNGALDGQSAGRTRLMKKDRQNGKCSVATL